MISSGWAEHLLPLPRGGFVEESAYRFAGFEKRWIVAADTRLGHNGDHGPMNPAAPQRVAQRLLKHVANRALRISDGIVERHWPDFIGGKF